MSSRCQVRSLVVVVAALCLPALVHAAPVGVAWRDNLDAAKIEAAQSGRLLLLHFYTKTCAPCKVLDQTVLSQPQVGSAVERDYVPVKIDADASPALAHMFRIDRVPSEVVMTPQGNVLATLSTPDNPDGYVSQLQNLAQHFRQTTPGAPQGPAAPVNSAYAALPAAATPAMAGAAMGATASPAVPQQQSNPYGASPAVAQARPVTTPTVPAATLAAVPPAAPPATTIAANGAPTMPSNAMPQSYRNPMFAAPPATATTPAAPAGAVASTAAATPPAATNPAYAAVGATASTTPATTTPAAAPTAAAVPSATAVAVAAQAAAAPAVVRPAQPSLPANCPPVAFDGCCPVTLKMLNKWEPGSTSFGAIHRGRTYLFAGAEQRQQFLANPDSFSPVFAGYDPVLLLDKQQSVPGTRKFGFRYGDAFYLFSCAETRDRFQASPQTYAAGVRQAMARVDGAGGGTIRR